MIKTWTSSLFEHSLKMSAYIAGIVLMLSIGGCVASQGQSGTGILQSRLSWLQGTKEINIPLKGASIREIKIYGKKQS